MVPLADGLAAGGGSGPGGEPQDTRCGRFSPLTMLRARRSTSSSGAGCFAQGSGPPPFVPTTRHLGITVDVSNIADALDHLEGSDAR